MADKKISQLTSATTPLAGTEVLPIVQSATTVKVATDDLTVKNVRSNATSGILQIAGPAAASTRTMTVPDANFTAARTDAAQSFTGDQTLSTGNLIVGTAGKGVDFSANANAAGMTSELLTWYEEGTFTPSILFGGGGTGITYTTQSGRYVRIGRQVTVEGKIALSSKGTSTGAVTIRGLPFTVNAASYSSQVIDTLSAFNSLTAGGCLFAVVAQSDTFAYIMVQGTANRATVDNTYFNNNTQFTFQITYTV